MARIEPPLSKNVFTRTSLWIAARQSKGKLPEPFDLMAHRPLLLQGYGGIEMAFKYSRRAPVHLKALAEMKAAALCGCEWCLDYGTWLVAEGTGITEAQLRELPRFRESDAFDEDEKLVLEYAEGISRTPVEVSDELFERLRYRFEDDVIVELTFAAAIENFRARFNWALGIQSQDYVEGGFCTRAEHLEGAAESGAGKSSEGADAEVAA